MQKCHSDFTDLTTFFGHFGGGDIDFASLETKVEVACCSSKSLRLSTLSRQKPVCSLLICFDHFDALTESSNSNMEVTQIYLKSRPGPNSPPSEANFGVRQEIIEVEHETEQVLVKTLYLSVDPALRCRMNEDTGVHYLTPWPINETIEGLGGIGQVIAAPATSDYQVGDIVVSKNLKWLWQSHFLINPVELDKVPDDLCQNLPVIFSCLGLIGLTVLLGIQKKGGLKEYQVQDDKPLTMVISGAAGACGLLAGQIGKLEGAQKVIGICGSDEKCKIIVDEFGYDEAINYKTQNVAEALPKNGVHCYFDNVGGDISEAVIENMAAKGNVILCGQISQYNKDVPYPPPICETMQKNLTEKSITRDRFLVLAYENEFKMGLVTLSQWLLEGKLKTRECIIEGIEHTGKAFVDMMKGGNIGKQIVKV